MAFSITLVEPDPRVVGAWELAFADTPEVRVVLGSITGQGADAWVVPIDARGRLDGGAGAAVTRFFGDAIGVRVRREVNARFGGRLAVGAAACVGTAGLWAPPTGPKPLYLIAAPTKHGPAHDVSRTLNATWAFAAALQAAHLQNEADDATDDGVYSLAIPGLGAAAGGLAPESCARQMRLAYGLFRDRGTGFDSFASMRAALVARLVGGAPVRPPQYRNVPVTGVAHARPTRVRRSIFGVAHDQDLVRTPHARIA